jgi:hypothetical protein
VTAPDLPATTRMTGDLRASPTSEYDIAPPWRTARQGFGATTRRDAWWVGPTVTGVVFGAFVLYSLFSAFLWHPLFGAPIETQGYLSPFFSPLIGAGVFPPALSALLILWIPLGFRTTCYYYRKAYYRAYFADPPACAVGEPSVHGAYAMERTFPFVLQNLHRIFLYAAFVPLFFLWLDAAQSLNYQGHWRLGLGSLVLLGNVFLLTGYSLSCHSLRHLVGGRLDCFSCSLARRARYGLWQRVTGLNAVHMRWAWISLFSVAFADLYVRLLGLGLFIDPSLIL